MEPDEMRYRCVSCDYEWPVTVYGTGRIETTCPRCGGMTEIRMAAEAVCDFCSEPKPVWAYDCKSFSMPPLIKGMPVSNFIGGWAACDVCSNLIEEGRREDLISRSSNIFNIKYPMPPYMRDALNRERKKIHERFFENRIGPRIPAKEYYDPYMKK